MRDMNPDRDRAVPQECLELSRGVRATDNVYDLRLREFGDELPR